MTDILAPHAKTSRRERRAQERTLRRAAPREHAQFDDIPSTLAIAWPALLLFASGAAALIYQVLWIKQLSLVVGVEVQAVTIGVSAFLPALLWAAGYLAGWPTVAPIHFACMPVWKPPPWYWR